NFCRVTMLFPIIKTTKEFVRYIEKNKEDISKSMPMSSKDHFLYGADIPYDLRELSETPFKSPGKTNGAKTDTKMWMCSMGKDDQIGVLKDKKKEKYYIYVSVTAEKSSATMGKLFE